MFKCKKCGYCCTNGIVILYPEDLDRISKHLNLHKKEFIEKYCKKKVINVGIELSIYYLDNSKSCRFLDKENLCVIYNIKPLQCKLGPQKYFNSIDTWKNCIQYKDCTTNPFQRQGIPDEYFVRKLIKGYDLK